MKPSEMTTVELLEKCADRIAQHYMDEALDGFGPELRAKAARLRGLLASVHGAWDLSDENITRGYLLQRINEPSVSAGQPLIRQQRRAR